MWMHVDYSKHVLVVPSDLINDYIQECVSLMSKLARPWNMRSSNAIQNTSTLWLCDMWHMFVQSFSYPGTQYTHAACMSNKSVLQQEIQLISLMDKLVLKHQQLTKLANFKLLTAPRPKAWPFLPIHSKPALRLRCLGCEVSSSKYVKPQP